MRLNREPGSSIGEKKEINRLSMRTHRHLDLLDIDIKSPLLNILKEPKERTRGTRRMCLTKYRIFVGIIEMKKIEILEINSTGRSIDIQFKKSKC